MFWKDDWNNSIYEEKYQRAFSYYKNGDIPVQAFLLITDVATTFHLSLSIQAHDELRQIQREVANVELTNENDAWTCCWGAHSFKTTSYYNYYFRDIKAHVAFNWLCKTKCMTKIKVFGWLLLSDRLNTRNMLKRRHYNIGTNLDCLLCGQHIEETVEHMIFTCSFSKLCWAKLGFNWEPFLGRIQAVEDHRNSHPTPLFLEKFIVAAWSIWKERNNKHFRAITPSLTSWLDRFKKDFGLLQHRVKEEHRLLVLNLVHSL